MPDIVYKGTVEIEVNDIYPRKGHVSASAKPHVGSWRCGGGGDGSMGGGSVR